EDGETPQTTPDATKLQQRVAELEAENERLRQQVKALQDLLAETA
ncbi:MAG: plasmid replication/partition related protein, partial [Proteobacteria bacterium]|nr:plasmid replication/partition related protein [Pseudomonadota bacterium]